MPPASTIMLETVTTPPPRHPPHRSTTIMVEKMELGPSSNAHPPRPKSRPPRTTPKRWDNNHNHKSKNSVIRNQSTPSSVLISSALPLTRELSDLSGSYAGRTATTAPGNDQQLPLPIGREVVTTTNTSTPSTAVLSNALWSQARILSAREPHHPQPRAECDDSVRAGVLLSKNKQPRMVVEAMSVELIEDLDCKRRIPVIVLLMDPSRKIYELAQLWVDVEEDSVRDVLHAIQLNLHDKHKWSQDYDGMFQVRNHNFSQLIHILNIQKYDAQPFELWVAKPWSMSAKATVSYAGSLIHHLKDIEVLAQAPWRRGESILVLSKEARSRIYVPEGVLKHYHACQFLSFSPSFEPCSVAPAIRVDVLGADSEDGCSQLSDSLESSHRVALSVSRASASVQSTLFMKMSPSISRVLSGGVGTTPSTVGSASPSPARCTTPSTLKHTTRTTLTYTTPSTLKSMEERRTTLTTKASKSRNSLARVIQALNCSACKRDYESANCNDTNTLYEPTSTLLDSSTIDVGGQLRHSNSSSMTERPHWQTVWETTSTANSVALSTVSESAPLLKAGGLTATPRGWKMEI